MSESDEHQRLVKRWAEKMIELGENTTEEPLLWMLALRKAADAIEKGLEDWSAMSDRERGME